MLLYNYLDNPQLVISGNVLLEMQANLDKKLHKEFLSVLF